MKLDDPDKLTELTTAAPVKASVPMMVALTHMAGWSMADWATGLAILYTLALLAHLAYNWTIQIIDRRKGRPNGDPDDK